VLGFSGVFLYGFASALPGAVAKYQIEKIKIEEEVKARAR
jgi:hypothetical protein